ncbi:MAG: sigma-70 family RNA polymerase sigma factor [bacterium]|nr:sigma-70 family RNA polymerase sigma factor [bacterium]
MSIQYEGYETIELFISALKCGDLEAWTTLYEKHQREISAAISARLGYYHPSVCDDIAQEVWKKAFQRIGHFTLLSPEKGILPWLYGIVRVCCLRHFQESGQVGEVTLDDLEEDFAAMRLLTESQGDLMDQFYLDQYMQRLARFLPLLTPVQRDVLLLRGLHELPYKEVALLCDITPANAAKIFERVRKIIQDRLTFSAV